MTTQNFIDMYGLLLGENAGPVKKMMMVHAAYWALKSNEMRPSDSANVLLKNGFDVNEIDAALQILRKQLENK